MSQACGQPSRTCRRCEGRVASAALPRAAFTLLELLVVVGIIALLLALMLPGLAAARQQARRVQCQANLKQIALGWHSLLNETKGFFPRGIYMDFTYGGIQATSLTGYPAYAGPRPLNKHLNLPSVARKGGQVFRCPMDTGDRGKEQMFERDDRPYFDRYGSSFAANPMLVGELPLKFSSTDPAWEAMGRRLNAALAGLNVSQVSGESRLVLAGDGAWTKSWSTAWKPEAAYWHGTREMYNMAFLDGHVDYVQVRKGINVAPKYTTIPFANLQSEAAQYQAKMQKGR